MKKCLILCFPLLSNAGLVGQYALQWSKIYLPGFPGCIKDIQIIKDGGYIAIGEYVNKKND